MLHANIKDWMRQKNVDAINATHDLGDTKTCKTLELDYHTFILHTATQTMCTKQSNSWFCRSPDPKESI